MAAHSEKSCEICPVCCCSTELLQLGCQHAFCKECLMAQLNAQWPGVRIGFAYLNCALCRAPLAHNDIEQQLDEHRQLKQRVVRIAKKKFIEDGFDVELKEMLRRDATEEELEASAYESMAVYMCSECNQPYCGGRVDCAVSQELTKDQLKCHECEWSAQSATKDYRCYIHGHRFAAFKCDFCCSLATWNCTVNHYCDRCHNEGGCDKLYACPGAGLCPLGVPHPRNLNLAKAGEPVKSFVLGCMGCLGFMEAQDSNDERFYGGVHFGEQNMWDGLPDVDFNKFSTADELVKTLGEATVRQHLKIKLNLEGQHLDLFDAAEILLLQAMDQKLASETAEDEKRFNEEEQARENAERRELEEAIDAEYAKNVAKELRMFASEMDAQALSRNADVTRLDCIEEKAERDSRRMTRLSKIRQRREVADKQNKWRRTRMADNRSVHRGDRKGRSLSFCEDLWLHSCK